MSYGVNTKDLRNIARPFSIEEIKAFGSTLVFAPHPDDESLACGGLIALLRSLDNPVHVIFVSDGSLSHPGSAKFPAEVLSALRAKEAITALSFLDTLAAQVYFMNLKDGSLPQVHDKGFKNAVETIVKYIETIEPKTIVIPWRRDTHPDHRACWQLVNDAILTSGNKIQVLEYPLWLWERGADKDLPEAGEVNIRSVDIADWLRVKEMAVNAHQSQVTHMIDDDPGGFWLSPEVIAHFMVRDEIFLTAAETARS